jgi:hypothetical protein
MSGLTPSRTELTHGTLPGFDLSMLHKKVHQMPIFQEAL